MNVMKSCVAIAAAAVLLACGGADPGSERLDALPDAAPDTTTRAGTAPADSFWITLQAMCGSAHAGRVVEAPAGDTTFAGRDLIMHVRDCTDDEVRVPFHVGGDRSRTWVLTRVAGGLQLKHDHRHQDGGEDAVTQYGGMARAGGTAARQEFPADSFTTALLPAAATNVWTIELVPGRTFVYALRREGTDRRYRIEFDLTSSVPPPPAPWGAR